MVFNNTFFGDPSMHVWTNDPGRFSVECVDAVYRDLVQNLTVTVRDQVTQIGLANVLVTLSKGDEVYGRGFTDVTGRVYITIKPGSEGIISVTADKPNFYAYQDSIMVDTYCDDALAGDANGNGVLNGVDVVFLTNYFKGGPHPPDSCMCGQAFLYHAADANGNCVLNGVDVVYLTNYFKGGPAPFICPTCGQNGLLRRDVLHPVAPASKIEQ